MFRCTPERTS